MERACLLEASIQQQLEKLDYDGLETIDLGTVSETQKIGTVPTRISNNFFDEPSMTQTNAEESLYCLDEDTSNPKK